MPATDERVHKHLRRLERVWVDSPIYFITTCTFERRPILSSSDIAAIFVQEWRTAHNRHGWAIGRYVIMPDHVHFFCRAELSAKPLRIFMQKWKQWTSKRIGRDIARVGIGNAGTKKTGTLWQEEFFDHILRSSENYSQKWEYVKENPVRAGLVKESDDWPFQGEIESLML
jgi:REP-associated tyrosine transposase